MGIIAVRDEEMESIRQNEEMEERDKNMMLRAKKMKSMADVLEEVAVVIDMHFFVEFSQTKSSTFLKKVIGPKYKRVHFYVKIRIDTINP